METENTGVFWCWEHRGDFSEQAQRFSGQRDQSRRCHGRRRHNEEGLEGPGPVKSVVSVLTGKDGRVREQVGRQFHEQPGYKERPGVNTVGSENVEADMAGEPRKGSGQT